MTRVLSSKASVEHDQRSVDHETLAVAMIGSRGFWSFDSGLESHVRELAKELTHGGTYVTVYGRASREPGLVPITRRVATSVEAKDVFCLQGKFTATVSNALWATADAIRSQRYDIIHFHGVGCVFAVLLARILGIPSVLTLHSTNWREGKWSSVSKILIRCLERVAVRSADRVIAVSRALQSRLNAEHGARAHLIPNGVHQKGSPDCDEAVLRSFGLEKNRFVLYAGRIVPDKGCHVVLEAFIRAGLNAILVFAGHAPDEDYLESLKIACSEDTLFTGFLDEAQLGALYRNCLVFCSASVSEGQSIVVLEALAHGAQCLVSDIPAHRELVDNNDMLFPVGNSEDLRRKLERIGYILPGGGRHHVGWMDTHPQYQMDYVSENTMDVYRSLLNRTRNWDP